MEEKIQNIIKNSLKKTLGIEASDYEENLLTLLMNGGKSIVDLVYVFADLEEKFQLPITKVLKDRTYTVLSINGITKAIIEEFGEYRLCTIE